MSATGVLVARVGERAGVRPIAGVASIGAAQTVTTDLINLRRAAQRGEEVRIVGVADRERPGAGSLGSDPGAADVTPLTAAGDLHS
ncbi:MAG: hypothetical protein HY996_03715 [Micrococcales bacterium]|nr:hypothetical protein [Micrococcales bacterium]